MRLNITKEDIITEFSKLVDNPELYVGEYEYPLKPKCVYHVSFHQDIIINYEILKKYSDLFETKNINIIYSTETEDYSELTPGDRSYVAINIF